jgi:hypothetical protein
VTELPDDVPQPSIPEDQKELFGPDNTNLALWNRFFLTDGNYVRKADKGSYKFHTVDASYNRWRATALWGPYGRRWGLRDMKVDYIKAPDGRIEEAILHATFYYPGTDGKETAFEVINDWPYRRAGETLKKLWTNTVTKALSYLGVSGDIWFGRFEDDPYLEQQTGSPVAMKGDDMIAKVRKAPADKLEKWYEEASQKRGVNRFYYGKLKEAYDARRLEIEANATFGGSEDDQMDRFTGSADTGS